MEVRKFSKHDFWICIGGIILAAIYDSKLLMVWVRFSYATSHRHIVKNQRGITNKTYLPKVWECLFHLNLPFLH